MRARLVWLAAGVGLVAIVVVLVWFQPQKLFIDDRVDEAIPESAVSADGTTPGPGSTDRATDADAERARGEFVSIDHGTQGVARVLGLPGREGVVRLEGFETSNGPDLFVYLSTNDASGDEGAFDDDFVNLGRLKGNKGDQNYTLTADVDLSRYRSVVIWCDRFNSAFGAANLAVA